MKKNNNLTLNKNEKFKIDTIYKDIKEKVINARTKVLKQIGTTMTEVYWYVWKIIFEIYNNSNDGTYGKRIIDVLSQKLTNEFGNGFSYVSIRRMRRFYEYYPNWSTVSTELSWAHYQELIKLIKNEKELLKKG